MRDNQQKITDAGFQIILVGMGDPQSSEKFKEEMKIDFPLICDPARDLYREYQLGGINMLNMLSPRVIMKGLSAMAQGHSLKTPRQDPAQSGGVFIIDTDGIIRWKYIPRDPSDIPGVDHFLHNTIRKS